MLMKVLGQEPIQQRLQQAWQRDRLASAYLLVGPKGVGKASLAWEFARQINCECSSKHTCQSCQLFLRKAHPDFHWIRAEGQFIRIGAIQKLIDQMSLKPAMAKKRVVLVKDAERMNAESANAFLKLLEEPPLDSLLLLTTTDESRLLDTILSRCQKHYFQPLEPTVLAEILQQQFSLEEEAQALIRAHSRGRIRKDWIAQASHLHSLRLQAWQILSRLKDTDLEGHVAQLERILDQKLEELFLEMLGQLLRDVRLWQAGQRELAANPDLMQKVQETFAPQILDQGFHLVMETSLNLQGPVNKALALEALLLGLKRLRQDAVLL